MSSLCEIELRIKVMVGASAGQANQDFQALTGFLFRLESNSSLHLWRRDKRCAMIPRTHVPCCNMKTKLRRIAHHVQCFHR
jgi:hypothetical protein